MQDYDNNHDILSDLVLLCFLFPNSKSDIRNSNIMRALLLHANKFKVNIIERSSRPYGIVPEEQRSPAEEMDECLVAFFCVERNDTANQLDQLYEEIKRTAVEVSTTNLMISPFVHLSKNIADPAKAKVFYESLLNKFDKSIYTINSSHFGYHKSLLLDIKGHPGSFRYREF